MGLHKTDLLDFFRIFVLAHLTYLQWPFKVKIFGQNNSIMTTDDRFMEATVLSTIGSSEVASCQKKIGP